MSTCLDLCEKASYRCWEGLHGEGHIKLFQRAYVESLEVPSLAVSIDPDYSSQGSINPPNFFPERDMVASSP